MFCFGYVLVAIDEQLGFTLRKYYDISTVFITQNINMSVEYHTFPVHPINQIYEFVGLYLLLFLGHVLERCVFSSRSCERAIELVGNGHLERNIIE